MKLLLMGACIALSLSATAQCSSIDCTAADNVVDIGDGLSSSYEGSTCFSGNGEIPTWVNPNNWPFMSFSSEEGMYMKQNINFGTLNDRVQTHGNVRLKYISMNGSDTIFVTSGTLQIDAWVANGYTSTTQNTIVLQNGAELFVNGIQTYDGAILNGGGDGQKIKVIAGCVDEPLPINKNTIFDIVSCINVRIRWDVADTDEDHAFVESRGVNETAWKSHKVPNTGHWQAESPEPKYYRLKLNGKYSEQAYIDIAAFCGESQMNIFPNPLVSGSTMTIDLAKIKNTKSIEMYNIAGQIVYRNDDINKSVKVSLKDIAAGTYIIRVNTSAETFISRIIIK